MSGYLAVEAANRDAPTHWRRTTFKRITIQVKVPNTASDEPLLSLASTGAVSTRLEMGGLGRQAPSDETVKSYWKVRPDQVVVNPMWLVGGSVGVSDVAGAVSPAYRVYQVTPGVHPRYVHHLLRSYPFMEQYRLLGRGDTTFDRSVGREDFEGLPLALPPLEVQQRIADFLDVQVALLDRVIDLRSTQERLLNEHAASVIEKAFNPWAAKTVPIAALCSQVVDCVNKTAPTSVEQTRFKMIRTTNVRNGRVDLKETFTVDESTFQTWNRRGTPRRGDVLLTREAPVGEAGILDTDEHVFLGQRIVLYRPRLESASSEFLLLALLSPAVQRQLELRSAGSLHAHLRVGDCLKIQVPAIPVHEQEGVVRALVRARATSLRAAQLGQQQAALLLERKQALIAAAVTGQFDVTTARSVA